MKRPRVLAAVLWLACGAMAVPARAERLPIRSFAQADGLAHDRVKRVVADTRGFVWFCTPEGLSRFDGETFVTYDQASGLPVSSVNDVLELKDGTYLIATNGGGTARFDPRHSRRGGPAADGSAPLFLPEAVGTDATSNRVNALFLGDGGRVLAGTDGGLFVREPGAGGFTRLTLGFPNRPDHLVLVWDFARGPDGSIWIGTSSGLARLDPDGRISVFSVWSGAGRDQVLDIAVDPNGLLWLAHEAGLVVWNPGAMPAAPPRQVALKAVKSIEDAAADTPHLDANEAIGYRIGLPGQARTVRALVRTARGALWIGTTGAGLFRIEGGRVQRFGASGGLSEESIVALTEDRAGNLWVGTPTTGAMRIARTGFRALDALDGLRADPVLSIREDRRGHLTVVTDGFAIHRYDGARFVSVRPTLPDGIAGPGFAIQDHRGEWWMTSVNGLYRLGVTDRVEDLAGRPPARVYRQRDGLSASNVTRVFEDSAGDLWLGVADVNGVMINRWRRQSDAFDTFGPGQGLPLFSAPDAFFEDRDGTIWVGLRNGGLARWRGGRFERFDGRAGIPSGAIRAIFQDRRGRLWLAADAGGLCRIDTPAAEVPACRVYTTAEGLSTNNTRALTQDAEGRLYVGTERGVDRLDPETGRIRHFTTSDGLGRSEVEVAYRARDGVLWFGTLQGVSRYVPEPDPPQQAPAVYISRVRVAGVDHRLPEFGQDRVDGVRLGSGQVRLDVEFYGLGANSADRLEYEYRIPGLDDRWAPARGRAVTYAGLPSGAYRFEVRAATSNGVASPPATLRFSVDRPAWQSWWFLALIGLGLGGLAYAAHRFRLARILDIERVRMHIATDLHDDIGASLSQIAILSEVTRRQIGDADPLAADRLESIATASRDLVDAMSDVVWAINPKRDSLADLIHRMRRFANDALTPRDIALIFTGPPEGQDQQLGPEIRREIYLVLKEAVNNAARHSGATIVTVDVSATRHELRLTVKDNGRGFAVADAGDSGNGLASFRRRAARVNGVLAVSSEAGRGTTVDLRVPIGGGRLGYPYPLG